MLIIYQVGGEGGVIQSCQNHDITKLYTRMASLEHKYVYVFVLHCTYCVYYISLSGCKSNLSGPKGLAFFLLPAPLSPTPPTHYPTGFPTVDLIVEFNFSSAYYSHSPLQLCSLLSPPPNVNGCHSVE